jgi:acyl dehydratase
VQYFEDMPVGTSSASDETYTFTAAGIKDFASQWDPMPFHIDEEMAKQTPLGKLFACSAHTISCGIRLTHSHMVEPVAAVAGLGWNNVNFPMPVCAGDTVRLESEVIEQRASRSKPDRGIVVSRNRLFNQDNELVAEFDISTMILKRPEQ